MTKYKYINKGTGLSTFAVAFFASVPTLNMIITKVIPNTEGMMMVTLYVFSYLLIILSSISNPPSSKPSVAFLFVLASIVLAFILSQDPSIPSLLKLPNFMVFAIIPFVIPQLVKVDARRMVFLMMALPAFGVMFISRIFSLTVFDTIEMDLTYSFLTPIVAILVYFFSYYKQSDVKNKVSLVIFLIINLVYFIFCLLFGSRAASLSIVLCVIFLACTKINTHKVGFRIKPIFWLFLILLFLLVLFFKDILYSTASIFKSYNLDSYQLDKMITLYEMGDLSDGRSAINDLAINGIINSPLYGYGLSASQPITNYAYPHNFVFQLLLDGGILLFLSVMIPMIFNLIRIKQKGTNDEYLLMTTLFFASVPGALFSMDLWENQRFWLFMGFLLSNLFKKTCAQKFVKQFS